MGCERNPAEVDAPSAEPPPPGRNGQPEFEVLIDDESVMGDEDGRRQPPRSLREARS
jgi:hypothetical protein